MTLRNKKGMSVNFVVEEARKFKHKSGVVTKKFLPRVRCRKSNITQIRARSTLAPYSLVNKCRLKLRYLNGKQIFLFVSKKKRTVLVIHY